MQDIVKKQNDVQKEPSVPGFGMGGLVVCPRMSITHPAQCAKQGCALWLELTYGEGENKYLVGRCSDAWTAYLMVEQREALDRLTREIKSLKETLHGGNNGKS